MRILHNASYGIPYRKCNSEKLFDENDITFLNATGKLLVWLVRGGFDCYRTISGTQQIISKSSENWKVFEIRDAFVACEQLFQLCPAERPVMRHYVLECNRHCFCFVSSLIKNFLVFKPSAHSRLLSLRDAIFVFSLKNLLCAVT